MSFLFLNRLMKSVKNENGSLLILVLFALMTLSLLALSVGHTVRQKLLVVSHLEARENLRLAAEAAAQQASLLLSEKMEGSSYQSLNQSWANNESLWEKASIGSIQYSIIAQGDGDAASTIYGLIDEDRKINLNTAKPNVLQSLFQLAAGVESESARRIVASIQDWKDEDEDFHDGGAESKTYLNRQSPYRAKNALFNDLQELLWVEGISSEIFSQVKPFLTLDASQVNINTASKTVLTAMGFNANIASKIVLFRQGKDEKEGTDDDGFFSGLNEVSDVLSRYIFLNEADRQSLDSILSSGFSVSSTFFEAHIEATSLHHKQKIKANVMMNSQGVIQRWHEEFF